MQKTGILVVSFGTSYHDSLVNNIQAIEKTIGESFPGCELRRAFTSGMIIRKLKTRDGIHVDTVAEALDSFLRDGFTDLIVQPTHIINGVENDHMLDVLRSYKNRFHSLRVGTPLLTTTEDYRALISSVMKEYTDLKDDEFLVFMGHGTDHDANAVYPALDYMLKADGYSNVYIGTVEGYPDLEAIRRRMQEFRPRTVWLMPLMVVAGDHAVNDMAGPEEDSWQSVLTADGWQVRSVLQGLGELPAVRRIYLDHLARVTERLQ